LLLSMKKNLPGFALSGNFKLSFMDEISFTFHF